MPGAVAVAHGGCSARNVAQRELLTSAGHFGGLNYRGTANPSWLRRLAAR